VTQNTFSIRLRNVMRAMLLERPGAVEQSPLHCVELETPVPGAGELRVHIRCCGVCHTDLHIAEGELVLPKLPVVPGHQIVGIVEAVGRGVQRFREGDRVGIPWLYATCGKCRYCRSGLENLCEQARFTGYHVHGGYAEAAIVQEDFCYALPGKFSHEHAAPLLCAGIIGYRSFRLSGAKTGDWLGLYGFGASAHIVLQFARYLGVQVAVFTRTGTHAEMARALGAAWVGDARQQPPAPLDGSIIFAPAGGLVPEALRATRPGGTVACAGIAMSPIPQMDYGLLYHERVLRSVANSTRLDAREFLELAAEVPVETMIRVFPMEEANQALQLLKHSHIDGAGVLSIA
jgi:propanol-preferring alcohol dehydrogenase